MFINCIQDLRRFGIEALTGEACAYGGRILCDLTETGRRALANYLGLPDDFRPAEAWNGGGREDPHVGSVMLPRDSDFAVGLGAHAAAFVLGWPYVALLASKGSRGWDRAYAAEPGGNGMYPAAWEELWLAEGTTFRRLRAVHDDRTQGDRNVHQISQRVA